MKRCILKFLCCSLLLACNTASYAKNTLHYSIVGLSGDIQKSVEQSLNIKQQEELTNPTPKEIQVFVAAAPYDIKIALQPFGYFQAEVTSSLTNKGEDWFANFVVKPQTPVKISSLDISMNGDGATDPILKHILTKNPMRIGSVLNTEAYKNFKQDFFDVALNHGYMETKITENAIKVDLKKHTANIILHFHTGPRYKFGNVTFSPSPFSEKFLHRFIPFQEGELYASNQLLILQNNLNNSGYFKNVSVTQNRQDIQRKTVPIQVELELRPNYQYDLGAGFGTDTGVRGLVGLEVRHLSDNGQHLKSFIKASNTQNSLEVRYLIPGKNPTTDQYDISAAAESRRQKYGDSRAFKLSGGYTTVFRNDWRQTLRLSLQQERYNLTNHPKQNTTFLIPSWSIMHLDSDNPVKPTRGHRINLTVQGAIKGIIARNNFFQAQLDAKWIHPFSSMNSIILRGTLGYTAINDINNLPLSLQYFAGGAQSVRGYAYNGLGPGRNLTVASAEFRQKVVSDWYAVGFFDLGNSDNSFRMRLKRGTGLGVAWLSPLGTLELTYAKALDNPGTPSMVQFSMGPEF